MNHISNIKNPTVVTAVKNLSPNNCNSCFVDPAKADFIIQKAEHLVNPDFKNWYYKKLFELGERVFVNCIELAGSGRNPQKLFSYWLNHADKIILK